MKDLLIVKNLCKDYPSFSLKDVSFSLKEGTIMGFIGRNGAGKTTTLKCLLNLVHPNSGGIEFFGKTFDESEEEIKQQIGFASGGVDYYSRKKIKDIAKFSKKFYSDWDDKKYFDYLARFSLDENKRVFELSCGMKVKFNLLLALSHGAKILLLDEPTSGLDPVSREDLLDLFITLADEGVAVLFSTHITSDLDKCAEYITYIKNGEIFASKKTNDFIKEYLLVRIEKDKMTEKIKSQFIGIERTKDFFTGLILASQKDKYSNYELIKPTLEAIMTHIERGER